MGVTGTMNGDYLTIFQRNVDGQDTFVRLLDLLEIPHE